MTDALTALAGGDQYELAVAEINALHAAASRRIRIAARPLGLPAPVEQGSPPLLPGRHSSSRRGVAGGVPTARGASRRQP